MAAGGFLQTLLTFPKDTITEEMVELLEPYISAEDYNLESAKKSSGDVAGRGIIDYIMVNLHLTINGASKLLHFCLFCRSSGMDQSYVLFLWYQQRGASIKSQSGHPGGSSSSCNG